MVPVPNPYNPLEPVENPDWFFGRQEAFAFFRQHLVGMPLDRALVLIGRRGLGKSALLRQLQRHIDESYRVCVIDLNLVDLRGEEGLFAALVDEIRATLEAAEVSTYRLPDWPPPDSEEASDRRAWFREVYLDIALSALRHRHLVIALDDAHLLLDAIDKGALPADFTDYLAALQAAHERLDFVFALDISHEDRALTIPLLADPALHFRLSELAPEEAERIVREPVAALYSFDEGLVPRILALADGHPFLLTSICRLIFRRSEERHHAGSIMELDLIAVYPAALEQAGDILRPLWRDASQNERLTLTALARLTGEDGGPPVAFDALHMAVNDLGYEVSKTQLASALRSLDYKGLVRMDASGRYAFPALLIPRWLYANTEIPAPAAPDETARNWGRPALVVLGGIALVGIIGAAALSGVLSGGRGDDTPAGAPGSPTATLSLNLEATRQAEFATQTEQARPTATRTPTDTPQPTDTPPPSATPTATPSMTPSRTPTRTATPTDTPSPTNTPRPSATPTRTPTPTPSRTPSPSPTRTLSAIQRAMTATAEAPVRLPTNTLRPSPIPTLDPGG